MKASDFLRALWGDRPPGYVELWALRGKRSQYLTNPVGADVIASEGTPDVYTGTCLAYQRMDGARRAPAAQRIAIAGLWLDLDVNGGPDSKTGVAPSKADALIVAGALLAPTLVVDSGYGVHAWWLLDQPWRFATIAEQQQAAQASAQWYALHRARAQARGWSIDHTHDLARLLRVPGTVNGKDRDNPAPVRALASEGPRYERAELLQLCATAGLVDSGRTLRPVTPLDVLIRWDAGLPEKAAVLAENVPEFAAALQHAGHPAWSMSRWDMSLASQAAGAGWSNQEITDLICWHRRRWDGQIVGSESDKRANGRKALRRKYIESTIALARSRADRDEQSRALGELARTAA